MASEPIEKIERSVAPSTFLLTWLRNNRTRLLKFAGVGASGVLVNLVVCNLAIFVLLTPWLQGDPLFIVANFLGFMVSVFTNFIFNDRWTWGDRQKGGRRHFFYRMAKYYFTASGAGAVQIITAWLSLTWIWSTFDLVILGFDLSPSLSILTGIGCGMILNFGASHLWAFRDAPERETL